MIIIYDFDGTLTPYPFPQYEIISRCELSYEELFKKINDEKNKHQVDDITAFINVIKDRMVEKKIKLTPETLFIGANKIFFNPGLISYFEKFNNVSHYIVSSGFKEYIERTKISKYFDHIYGTIININKNEIILKDKITPKRKVDIIKEIVEGNSIDNIIYIGDGYTDKYAFEYVHSIGGKTIFLSDNPHTNEIYKELLKLGIIDKCFKPDFNADEELYKYIKKLLYKKD